jgi:hypothetical protein
MDSPYARPSQGGIRADVDLNGKTRTPSRPRTRSVPDLDRGQLQLNRGTFRTTGSGVGPATTRWHDRSGAAGVAEQPMRNSNRRQRLGVKPNGAQRRFAVDDHGVSTRSCPWWARDGQRSSTPAWERRSLGGGVCCGVGGGRIGGARIVAGQAPPSAQPIAPPSPGSQTASGRPGAHGSSRRRDPRRRRTALPYLRRPGHR